MTLLPVLFAALALGPSGDQAQASPAAMPLGAMTVTGARRYSEADVTRLTALKPGQAVSPSDLDAVVKQMAGTGLFASLQYKFATSGGRMDVTFQIEEPAWAMPVMLDNFVWMSDEELVASIRQHVPTYDGTLPINAEVTTFVTGVLQGILDERRIKGRAAAA